MSVSADLRPYPRRNQGASRLPGVGPGSSVRHLTRCAREHGVTLIELMIGLTLGLILMAGTLALFAGHLTSNNELMRTTRLNNELRGAMDMIVRDIRRASYWGNSISGVWYPNTPGIQVNPFLQIDAANAGQFTYRYDNNGDGIVDTNETYRFQRNATDGTIELVQLAADGNTATSTVPVSDEQLTEITQLAFALTDRTATTTCLKTGAGPTTPTPPLLHIRQITVTITGRLRADTTVTRTLSESVRLRNDRVEGSCPT